MGKYITLTPEGNNLRVDFTDHTAFVHALVIIAHYGSADTRTSLEKLAWSRVGDNARIGLIESIVLGTTVYSDTHRMNDWDIMKVLMHDILDSGEYTWLPGDTYAMHGSFLLVKGDFRRITPMHRDGNEELEAAFDKADYWYDNYYAVRNILVDMIRYYVTDDDERGFAPVVLWAGPKEDE